MSWDVCLSAKAFKQAAKLPQDIRDRLEFLLREMRELGPARTNRPNYGKLRGKADCHHCHLKKGNPTYVAVWQVRDKTIRLIEVVYVGTHEKADYRRLC
jgi:mRNA-degrading endonuclease RelE of RelBE toxin-antitoxin system